MGVGFYLSISAYDDLSQMIVHGGHGLADRIQRHVYLFLSPVAVGKKANQPHYNLQKQRTHSLYSDSKSLYLQDVLKVVTRLPNVPILSSSQGLCNMFEQYLES